MNADLDRREFLRRSLAVSAGAALASGAAAEAPNAPGAAAGLPAGRIGKLSVSRLLLGGNLLTHFTHSRELKYVYALTRQYNTPEKIVETLALAEAFGINTLVIHSDGESNIAPLKRHRKDNGGKMQWIICPTGDLASPAFQEQVSRLVDAGAQAIYLWGVKCDKAVQSGKAGLIGDALELVRAHGVPCGVGAHDLEVVRYCEAQKLPADFYIKTFHHHRYKTAPRPEEIVGAHAEIPGYWCSNPDETAALMKTVEKPWIAFKVMAAGAIPPADAFAYVLNHGADFVLAGMFDFEIREDVEICRTALAAAKRERPWRA